MKVQKPLLWALLSAALFGASTPAAKHLLAGLSPLLLAGLLYTGAAAALAPVSLAGWRSFAHADRRSWMRLLGAVLFGGVVGPVLLLFGLSMAPAGSVALWLNLETVATAVLAAVFFKEHLHRLTWIAVALIVAASALLSSSSTADVTAVMLVALACVAWGLDNNLTAILDRFTPAQIAFAKGAVAGGVNMSLGLALDVRHPALEVVGGALIVGALSYGVSILLYIRAAQQLGATRSQLVFSTAPAWGLAISWIALAEPIAWQQLLAMAMMGAAIWLWNRERHTHPHVHDPLTHTHWHRHEDAHHEHVHGAEVPPGTWHSHAHEHESVKHHHEHRPDLHHRHDHDED